MIYIHVPFCRSFCRYCDFYSEIACRGRENTEGYTSSLLREIESRREEILESLGTDTLYIGGGTPSVMPLPFFSSLLEALPVRSFEEFTVEVNPDDIVSRGAGFCKALRELGVNRISMGVQSMDDGMLKFMGRRHDAAQARDAVRILRESGFENISLDLIFGVNGMDGEMVRKSLEEILALKPQHISAYQLSIEEGSELARMEERGDYVQLGEDECAAHYSLICEILRNAGFVHYEISNWARPGFEARHNSAYWTRAPYTGLGPGAHSLRIHADGTQRRSWNSQTLEDWTVESETLTPEQIREEEIMLGLRTLNGALIDGKQTTIPEEKWFIADSIIEEYL